LQPEAVKEDYDSSTRGLLMALKRKKSA
jgi:hypothetical protein